MAGKDQTTGPPDFVGVGAQRAGTTWWFRTLVGHPRLRPARGRKKELHFFDPFAARELTDEDVAAYHRLFPRVPGELAGEWTPRYMRDFWAPPLLRRAAPRAKLLVMLRDPIERYRSGVPHRLSRTPERERESIAVDSIERSRYGKQVERLLRHYARDEVLVQQYERCLADPVGEYRRTLRFLGVDEDHEPREVERERGTTTAATKEPLWDDMLACLHRELDADVERLAELVPELDLSLWPNFAHLVAGGAAR